MLGEGPDASDSVPAQSDGRPFYDGTVDALDFFLSTPDRPFAPRPSCETGTSHAPKQQRRVKAGLNAAYNPFAHLLDRDRICIAGHSYGAAGVSYVGQWDPRVKAIVAWDNLGPADPAAAGRLGERPCPADPDARRPVHDGLVRQVRQGRSDRRRPAAHHPLAGRPLVLLPLAARHRRRLRLRGTAGACSGMGGDGLGSWSYLRVATSPDAGTG